MLTTARAVVTNCRCELALASRGAEDEGVCWITGARSQVGSLLVMS